MIAPRRLILFLLVLFAIAGIGAYLHHADAKPIPPYQADIPITFPDPRVAVQSSPDFNMLQNLAASIPHIERLFARKIPFTGFVPRNIAFDAVPRSRLNEIWVPGNTLWPKIFWHHFAIGEFREEKLRATQTITMMDESAVKITKKDGGLLVDGVPIIGLMLAPGWTIYVIDSLLVPDSAKAELFAEKR